MTLKTMAYTLSIFLLLTLTAGCDGPTEEAGENIDQTVEMQKEKLKEAKEEIAEAKEELQEQQEELTQARKERDQAMMKLQESEQERQRVLEIMEEPTMTEKGTDGQVAVPEGNDAQLVEEQEAKETGNMEHNSDQSPAEQTPSGSAQ